MQVEDSDVSMTSSRPKVRCVVLLFNKNVKKVKKNE